MTAKPSSTIQAQAGSQLDTNGVSLAIKKPNSRGAWVAR